MKRLILISCLSFLTVQFTSCKNDAKDASKKEAVKKEVKPEKSYPYSLKKATNTVDFVAYKTTDKVPVKGTFKTVKVLSGAGGNTIKEAVNGTEFKIPIGSVETNDSSRNLKIQKFFFQMMEATGTLKGKLNIVDEANGFADFTMNGITKKLPFTYTIEGNVFSLDATMDVNEWNGQAALASLNEACKALHSGADGVSKTWNEVAIHIVTIF